MVTGLFKLFDTYKNIYTYCYLGGQPEKSLLMSYRSAYVCVVLNTYTTI